MSKQVKVRIFPDGKVEAEVKGIKGKKCTKYIAALEELLKSKTTDLKYTKEFFEEENILNDMEELKNVNHNEK